MLPCVPACPVSLSCIQSHGIRRAESLHSPCLKACGHNLLKVFLLLHLVSQVGVLAGAFERDFGLDDDDDDEEEEGSDEEQGEGERGDSTPPPRQAGISMGSCMATEVEHYPPRSDAPEWRLWLCDLVDGGSESGILFERVCYFATFASILQAAVGTIQGVQDGKEWGTFFAVTEAILVLFFTIEYLLRLSASPELPWLRGIDNVPIARCRYAVSFLALVDLAAILPWYLARIFPSIDEYDHTFRLVRVMRLVALDKHYPGMSLIDDVIRRSSADLAVASFVAGLTWIVFASLLYITESQSNLEDAGRPMSERFADVPTAMSYTLILLSGDYPLIEFTPAGKVVNFFMILCAQVGCLSAESLLFPVSLHPSLHPSLNPSLCLYLHPSFLLPEPDLNSL